MKACFTLVIAFLLFVSNVGFSQDSPSVLERISQAKAGDGAPCVELSWKRGAEKTAYYLIERSVDGKEFKQVALVFTAEDQQFTDYKFRDKNYSASGARPYYRIGLVNGQNELSYLPARKVEL